MVNCNPNRTHVNTKSKLGDGGDPVFDPALYRSLEGSLQYLTFTRPNISYAVQQVCLYMHDHRKPYFSDLKRIFAVCSWYFGLWVTVVFILYYRFWCLFGCGLGWLPYYSEIDLSAEAKYRGVAETFWLRNLLRELHTPLPFATLVYYDNVSAVYLSSNLVRVFHVPSHYQFANIFTKGLPSALFEEFRSSLSIRCPPAPTTGEYQEAGCCFTHLIEGDDTVVDLNHVDVDIDDLDVQDHAFLYWRLLLTTLKVDEHLLADDAVITIPIGELKVAANSTKMPDQMLVYFDTETRMKAKLANDLSKLMMELLVCIKERQSYIEELKVPFSKAKALMPNIKSIQMRRIATLKFYNSPQADVTLICIGEVNKQYSRAIDRSLRE
ncbi:ribonuclease H-like domain-containing protein [Tanacetum coccineum]